VGPAQRGHLRPAYTRGRPRWGRRSVDRDRPPNAFALARRSAIACFNAYVYEALRAGASGFLLKDVLAEQPIAAVRVVAAGEA